MLNTSLGGAVQVTLLWLYDHGNNHHKFGYVEIQPSNYAYRTYMSKWKLEKKGTPQWLLLVHKSSTNLTGHLFLEAEARIGYGFHPVVLGE